MTLASRESYFSYPITRRYPFPWFTYVVVIGGILATVLFSFLNLATNGYNLETIYTTDPNSTSSRDYWFQHAPFSWSGQIKASCQPLSLTRGSTYSTSNFGLVYTLDKIWNGEGNEPQETFPSVSYYNTTMEDCMIPEMTIQMERRDSGAGTGNWWTWYKTYASPLETTATCNFFADSVLYRANWTIQLPPLLQTEDLQDYWLQHVDAQTQASLWWGSLFMIYWYPGLGTVMAYNDDYGYINESGDNVHVSVDTATISLTRNMDVFDPTSLDFWEVVPSFYLSDGSIGYLGDWDKHTLKYWWDTQTPDTTTNSAPNISINVDAFAKTFYSVVLTDFGQTNTANALATPEGINFLLDVLPNINQNAGGGGGQSVPTTPIGVRANTTSVKLPGAYDILKDSMGALGANNATLYTQYACSVPKRKATGSLLVSVLVADLVLLQAAWFVLNWVATFWLHHVDPNMNLCEACGGGKKMDQGGTGYEFVSHNHGQSSSTFDASDEEEALPWGSTGPPTKRATVPAMLSSSRSKLGRNTA